MLPAVCAVCVEQKRTKNRASPFLIFLFGRSSHVQRSNGPTHLAGLVQLTIGVILSGAADYSYGRSVRPIITEYKLVINNFGQAPQRNM
jgi:hypothetical protein